MSNTIRCLALASIATTASAQSFNIDVGQPGSPAGVPAAGYGAAAGQPGPWNVSSAVTAIPWGAANLVSVSGIPSGVSLSHMQLAGPPPTDFHANDAGTMGPAEQLMDDFQNVGPAGSISQFTFAGLTSGFYDVYTYTWTPNNATFVSSVRPADEAQATTTPSSWPGMQTNGRTHTLHCVEVTTGTLSITIESIQGFGAVNGFQLVKQPRPCASLYPTFCHGDGGNQMGCTDCPCGNDAPVGTVGGCLNSVGTSARLLAAGVASVVADTFRLELRDARPSTFALLSSGESLAPTNLANPCAGLNTGIQSPLFLDGLRCVVGNVIRLGSRSIDTNGDVGLTTPGWGAPHGPMGGILANICASMGQTRYYQVLYRDDDDLNCLTGQNSSDARCATSRP